MGYRSSYVICGCDFLLEVIICSVKHPTAMKKESNTEVCIASMVEKYPVMAMVR